MMKSTSKNKIHTAILLISLFFVSAFFVSRSEAKPEEASAISIDSNKDGVSVEAYAGKAKTIKLSKPVKRVAIGDPRVLDFILISPTQLYVTGKSIGSTNMILWYQDGSSKTYETQVLLNIEPLKAAIARDLPEEKDIIVNSASGSIVLSGSLADSIASNTLISLAETFLKKMSVAGDQAPGTAQPGVVSGQNTNIINLTKIRDPQQVMLQVKFAEVNKDLSEKLGTQFNSNRLTNGDNSTKWAVLSNSRTATTTSGSGETANIPSLTGAAFLSILLGDKNAATQLGISAEKVDGLTKILAEPTILAMSGQEGSFLSGGTIFIPVPTGGAINTITLQEREFGIGLKFLPTVLDQGRINLRVTPEVSDIGTATAAAIGSTSTSFPSFTKSRVSTTVQLNEGETLVIGGLLRDSITELITATPGLGELPILGALFRSTSFTKKKTELLVVVTPSLVKAQKNTPKLPTDNFIEPSRFELFMMNRLEGNKK